MIELHNICKSYKTRSGRLDVLHDISLTIEEGSFTMLYGASGSGKSTLLNILGLMDTPSAGKYLLDGTDTAALSSGERTKLRGTKIGFIFQAYNLVSAMTAFENVELPLGYRGVPKEERRKRAEEALAAVGLADRMHHKPASLSGGEQQRAAIARAMVMKPSVLLADEPTGNLDEASAAEIMSLLRSVNATVVMVSHDESLASCADTVLRLKKGRIE